jgi:hypothetical protein
MSESEPEQNPTEAEETEREETVEDLEPLEEQAEGVTGGKTTLTHDGIW